MTTTPLYGKDYISHYQPPQLPIVLCVALRNLYWDVIVFVLLMFRNVVMLEKIYSIASDILRTQSHRKLCDFLALTTLLPLFSQRFTEP